MSGYLTNILQGGQLNAPLRGEVLRFAMQFVSKNAQKKQKGQETRLRDESPLAMNAYMHFGTCTDVYKQLNGVPMGSPLSPPFATALVALLEDVTVMGASR